MLEFCFNGAEINVPNCKSISQALEQAKEEIGSRFSGYLFRAIKIPNGVTLRSAGNDEKGKSDQACGTRDS